MNNITSKIMKIGMATALGASLILLPSCRTVNDMDMLSLGLRGISKGPNKTASQRESAAMLSDFTGRMGERQHEKETAREGKPETNVNVYQQSNNAEYSKGNITKNSKSRFETFTNYVDLNKNGIAEKEEFLGLSRTSFSADEFIGYLYVPLNNEKKVTISLWDSRGKQLIEDVILIDSFGVYTGFFKSDRPNPGYFKLIAVPDYGEAQIRDIVVNSN